MCKHVGELNTKNSKKEKSWSYSISTGPAIAGNNIAHKRKNSSVCARACECMYMCAFGNVVVMVVGGCVRVCVVGGGGG